MKPLPGNVLPDFNVGDALLLHVSPVGFALLAQFISRGHQTTKALLVPNRHEVKLIFVRGVHLIHDDAPCVVRVLQHPQLAHHGRRMPPRVVGRT